MQFNIIAKHQFIRDKSCPSGILIYLSNNVKIIREKKALRYAYVINIVLELKAFFFKDHKLFTVTNKENSKFKKSNIFKVLQYHVIMINYRNM